jgi:hypothetical protein
MKWMWVDDQTTFVITKKHYDYLSGFLYYFIITFIDSSIQGYPYLVVE